MPRLLRTYPGLQPWDYDRLAPAEIDALIADLQREDAEDAKNKK